MLKYVCLATLLFSISANAQDSSQVSQTEIERSVGSLFINNRSMASQISVMKLQNDALTRENSDLKAELAKLRGDAPKIDTPKPD